MDLGDWLERWTTIVANCLAIGAVLLGAVPTVRWARRVQRELSAIRRGLGKATAESTREQSNFFHIQIGAAVGDNRWNITWSRLLDDLHTPDVKAGVATVTSPRLHALLKAGSLRLINSPVVVGAVRYVDREGKLSNIDVYRLDHVTGDLLWNVWFQIRLALWRLFGGD